MDEQLLEGVNSAETEAEASNNENESRITALERSTTYYKKLISYLLDLNYGLIAGHMESSVQYCFIQRYRDSLCGQKYDQCKECVQRSRQHFLCEFRTC